MREAVFHKQKQGTSCDVFFCGGGCGGSKVKREETEAKKGEKEKGEGRREKRVISCTHQCLHNPVLSA